MRRKETEQRFGLPDTDSPMVVEFKHVDGCLSDWRPRNDAIAIPGEMFVPSVRAGIEQQYGLRDAWQLHLDAIGLVQIAAWACPGQVVDFRRST